MVQMKNDSYLRYSEVPLKGKNKTLVKILGVVNTGRPCRSNIGGCDPCNPCGVDAYGTVGSLYRSVAYLGGGALGDAPPLA